eukprot:1149493-Pelagomonas_calceolata.AAC.4
MKQRKNWGLNDKSRLTVHKLEGLQGVGLQPESLAERLLVKVSQPALKIKTNSDENLKIYASLIYESTGKQISGSVIMWKLTKKGIVSMIGSRAKLTHLKANAIEESMYLVLDFRTHTYHKHLHHPAIYWIQPSNCGHEA